MNPTADKKYKQFVISLNKRACIAVKETYKMLACVTVDYLKTLMQKPDNCTYLSWQAVDRQNFCTNASIDGSQSVQSAHAELVDDTKDVACMD